MTRAATDTGTDTVRPRRGVRPAPLTTLSLDGDRPEYLARAAVTAVLAGLGISQQRGEEVELAVAELVANAGRHAPGPRELPIRFRAGGVRFAVADGGDDHAAIARMLAGSGGGVEWFEEHGRGLQIVAALFPDACGADSCGAGALG